MQNAKAKITFYADQPVTGSSRLLSVKQLTGHSYISVEQTVNGKQVIRTLGFHPVEITSTFNDPEAPSILGDDSESEYDVKYTVEVSGEVFWRVLTAIARFKPVYDLENYNCTNFVLDISDVCGLKIPRTKSNWLFGSSLNPGAFGQDLRKIPGAVFGNGKSSKILVAVIKTHFMAKILLVLVSIVLVGCNRRLHAQSAEEKIVRDFVQYVKSPHPDIDTVEARF